MSDTKDIVARIEKQVFHNGQQEMLLRLLTFMQEPREHLAVVNWAAREADRLKQETP